MSITRSQIARQLLAEGGVSLNDAQTMAPDGEFLAYINPKEAGILKAMGGSGRMTPMGIPSFTEDEEDTGDVSNPGGGSTGGSGGGNNGDDQEDDNARMMQAMGLTGPGFTNRGGGDDPPSFFDRVKSAITRFNPTRFSPTGIITRGLGNLFNKLGNLRGFNPDGTRRTQAEFERARDIRRAEKSIANIMGRDAPFTDLTLDRLADLYSVLGQNVPGNINESLIGTTNKMRTINDPVSVPITEGTMFDAEDNLGIVSQARSNPTFRDAMAQLNLERGVPRDQVFSTRTATGNNFNILDFAVPGHSKAMYEGKDSIVSNAPSVKDYHIAANADLSRRISDQLKNIPGVGEAASLGYDVVAPALSYPVSIGYDALQAKQRMEPGSGIKGFYDAFMNESPFSAAKYRSVGVSAPLAERIQGI